MIYNSLILYSSIVCQCFFYTYFHHLSGTVLICECIIYFSSVWISDLAITLMNSYGLGALVFLTTGGCCHNITLPYI